MGIVLKNNAETVLSASINSVDTVIPVSDVSNFPSLGVGDYFYCTIESTTGANEIVKVTQVNAASFNVVRAQEDTIAVPFITGARVELRVTVQALEDFFSVVVDDEIGSKIGVTIQAYDADLTTWAGLTPSANAQSLVTAADYSAMRTQLGLVIGTNVQAYDADLTTWAGLTPSANAQSLVIAADYSAMRTLLGLVIGTNVQAYDADLTTWAGLTPSANAQSLVTAADYSAMRTLLGLNTGNSPTFTGLTISAPLNLANGTESTPSISFGGDDGIYSPGAGYIGVTVNNKVLGLFEEISRTLLLYGDVGEHAGGSITLITRDNVTPDGAGSFINFQALTSTGVNKDAAQINAGFKIATNGAEGGLFDFAVYRNGTSTIAFCIDGELSSLHPEFSSMWSIGNSTNSWKDLYLSAAGKIDLGASDVTITHSTNALAFAGASSGYSFDSLIIPTANDGSALGSTSRQWSDLFLASGSVINFDNGDVTVTHSSNTLTFAGASTGYVFDAPITGTTVTGTSLISSSAGTPLNVTNTTDAAGNVGFILQSDRATPTNGDNLRLQFRLSDSAGNQDQFAAIWGVASVVTSASEEGALQLLLMKAGTQTQIAVLESTTFRPATNDLISLGTATVSWSDMFLAPGGVINFNGGNATLTHSTGRIASNVPIGLPSYTVAGLPAGSTGDIAYASNGRKNGEGAAAGTGVMVFKDGTAWRACDTGATVAA